MNLGQIIGTLIIDGAVKLVQKREYKEKENVLRIYDPRSAVPEKILYESKQLPGAYLDEVNDNVYTLKGNKLKLLF